MMFLLHHEVTTFVGDSTTSM